jgi:hypothetical protein
VIGDCGRTILGDANLLDATLRSMPMFIPRLRVRAEAAAEQHATPAIVAPEPSAK